MYGLFSLQYIFYIKSGRNDDDGVNEEIQTPRDFQYIRISMKDNTCVFFFHSVSRIYLALLPARLALVYIMVYFSESVRRHD